MRRVAEAEVLAAERDQVLEEIAGLRGLEDQAERLSAAGEALEALESLVKRNR